MNYPSIRIEGAILSPTSSTGLEDIFWEQRGRRRAGYWGKVLADLSALGARLWQRLFRGQPGGLRTVLYRLSSVEFRDGVSEFAAACTALGNFRRVMSEITDI